MKILILYNENNACDYHRTVLPFRYLDLEDGEKFRYAKSTENLRPSDWRSSSIVYVNRSSSYEFDTVRALHKAYGFKLWVDLDDDWELYPEHYLYDTWKKSNAASLIQKYIIEADVVTCTHDRLACKIRSHNENVHVVPNALPIGYEQFVPNKTESNKIRFMTAGGESHYHDLKSIQPAFNLCSNIAVAVRSEFVLAGVSKSREWDKTESIMKRLPFFSTRPLLPLTSYMEHYDYADVSLAPLQGNRFNTFKSNLKIIEAGCMSMPILVSKMYPYLQDETAKDKGVFFCSDCWEWFDKIRYFVENPDKVLEYGKKLYDYVNKHYNLIEVNKQRRAIINSIKQQL